MDFSFQGESFLDVKSSFPERSLVLLGVDWAWLKAYYLRYQMRRHEQECAQGPSAGTHTGSSLNFSQHSARDPRMPDSPI